MGKRINKKAKEGKETFFGIYQKKFELLELGTKKHLRDEKSDRGSFVPIEICGDSVYLSEPDGKLMIMDSKNVIFYYTVRIYHKHVLWN